MGLSEFFTNHLRKHEIGETEEDLMPIGIGISSIDASFEEESEDVEFYILGEGMGGGKETLINGISLAYSFSGYRSYGDKAQEFIRGKAFSTSGRDCYLRVTEPNGTIIEGPATVGVGKIHGGDAGSNAEFECTITFKGIPKETTAPPSGE